LKKIFLSLPILLFALNTSSFAVEQENTIPVAAIFALTGRGADSNVRHLQGAQLAVEQINGAGGVLGKKIELILLDNESTAIGSARAAKIAVQKKVVGIIGASWSAHSLAIAPIAQEAKIPMISNFSTNIKLTLIGDYIFRVCYIDTFQASLMAKFTRENLKLNRVAILYQSGNEYSVGLSQYFDSEFERLGGITALRLPYLADSLDYKDLLTAVQDKNVQAIYIPGVEKEPGFIIRQAYKMGMNIPFLGADSWGARITHYVGGPIKEGYEVRAWNENNAAPISQSFVKAYKKKYSEGNIKKYNDKGEVLSGSALAYDATMLLADAIKRAGSTSGPILKKSIQNTTSFVGVTGSIRFDSNRNPIKSAVIKRYKNSLDSRYYTTINP
jgi:branched-chain amino acid transport system substrate-binding protein